MRLFIVKDADLAPPSLTLLLTKQALKDLRIERRHRLWRRPIQRVRYPDAAGHGDGVSGRDLPRARLFAQWGFSGATRSRLRGVVREITQSSVQLCRYRAHAGLVTVRCEAARNVQGKPEPSGQPGLGEARTGERK